MNPVSPPALQTCSVCQSSLDPNGTCPRCRAPEDWNDRIEALDFVLRRLKDWQKEGQLTDRQLTILTDHYEKQRTAMTASSAAKEKCPISESFPPRDECWSCREYLYTNSSHCGACGAPITHPAVKSLRYYRYLYLELQAHEESGWLTLRQSHEFLSDTKERIGALKTRLERERAPMVIPVTQAPPPPPRPRRESAAPAPAPAPAVDEGPRRSFLEVMLDPQSIQWLMLGGGALFVIGLMIWLGSLNWEENKYLIATALGIGNAACIGGGFVVILKTRYQVAGRALTLLACLVMPLNLWFYDSYEILTLNNNLWIAALVCCLVYAAAAFVLKDAMFVYVLVAGITMTGLLIAAQASHFYEVLPATTLLIILGLICLHAERAFPDIDSPFSRKKFGMAFFWSAQFLFATGLLLLLGAQVIGWLHEPFFFRFPDQDAALRKNLPWTLALVLAGTYAYIYSDVVVRRIGFYLYLAAITLIWAEIHVLVLTNLTNHEYIVMITLALTALAINAAHVQFQTKQTFLRVVPPMGVLLSSLPVVFGVLLHFRAVNLDLNNNWLVVVGNIREPFKISWALVLSMALIAACCRASAFLYRHTLREVSVFYFFLTTAATLVAVAGLTWQIGLQRWEEEARFVMLVPVVYLIASYLYKGHSAERPLLWVGHTATVVMLVCSLGVALGISRQLEAVGPITKGKLNLLLALFCLEVSIFYGLASFFRRSNWTIYFAAIALCGAVWQLMQYVDMRHEYYTVAFALIGFVLLVVYRVGVFEKFEMPGLEHAAFQSGNALTTLGFVGGTLLSISRLVLNDRELGQLDARLRELAVGDAGDWQNPMKVLLYLLIFLSLISLASACIVQHPAWRRVHLILTVINGILLFLVIHRLSELGPWQKLEIASIILGVILAGLGYFGWYRETEKASDLVSFALFLGAVLLVVPFLIGAIYYRWFRVDQFGVPAHIHTPRWDDLGLVVSCVALFASGVVCRIKASSLIGSLGMIAYIFVILISAIGHLGQQMMIGVYLALGGGLLFGTGIGLSVYRDRLLALPEKIKRREGMFRFFDWR